MMQWGWWCCPLCWGVLQQPLNTSRDSCCWPWSSWMPSQESGCCCSMPLRYAPITYHWLLTIPAFSFQRSSASDLTNTTYEDMLLQRPEQDPHQMACCQRLIFTTHESTGVLTQATSVLSCIFLYQFLYWRLLCRALVSTQERSGRTE